MRKEQTRPQGFSLKKKRWGAPPIFWGKSPGDEVGVRSCSDRSKFLTSFFLSEDAGWTVSNSVSGVALRSSKDSSLFIKAPSFDMALSLASWSPLTACRTHSTIITTITIAIMIPTAIPALLPVTKAMASPAYLLKTAIRKNKCNSPPTPPLLSQRWHLLLT